MPLPVISTHLRSVPFALPAIFLGWGITSFALNGAYSWVDLLGISLRVWADWSLSFSFVLVPLVCLVWVGAFKAEGAYVVI